MKQGFSGVGISEIAVSIPKCYIAVAKIAEKSQQSIKSNFKSDLMHQIKNGRELTFEQYQQWRTQTINQIRNCSFRA